MQTRSKPAASLADRKKLLVRETILDAAERIVKSTDQPDFTMRRLAEEAGVSLTTPFAYFRSKGGILAALTDRMFRDITAAFERESRDNQDPISRVFVMGDAGVRIMLDASNYYRYICRSTDPEPDRDDGSIRVNAEHLWRLALGQAPLLRKDASGLHETYLPQLLGVAFRGVLGMWVSGEIADVNFGRAVDTSIAGVMLGVVEENRRPELIVRLARF